MDGKKWSNDCITSPNDSFGHPNAAEVEIGEIWLKPKLRFLYLFDYGDEWTFFVELDHIEEMDSTPIEPYVKAKNGELPFNTNMMKIMRMMKIIKLGYLITNFSVPDTRCVNALTH